MAEFFHVKHLFALEEHKTLKIAHKLKQALLNLSGISRAAPLHTFSK